MTFPTVIAEAGGNSVVNETSVTVNLPDGSNVAGRLILLFFTSDGSGETFTTPATYTWTKILTEGGTGFTSAIYFRRTTGTEGYPSTGATITVTVSSVEMSAHTTYLISGHHASSDPVASTGATGTSVSPDPDALNPADWDVEDTLWFAFASLNGASSTTPRITVYPTSYTNTRSDLAADPNGITTGVGRRQNATASENPAAFTSDTSVTWRAATVGVRPAGGITATVNQATETDTAQATAKQKFKAFLQSLETDLAQAITRVKRYAFAQNVETDTAQAIAKRKIKAMAQVVETDLAQVITLAGPMLVPVGQVTETDAAQAIAVRKIMAAAQVVETYTAQAIGKTKNKGVGQNTETDLAQAVTARKLKVLAQVLESDTPQTVSARKLKAFAQVVESDSAQAIAGVKQKTVGQISETDLAQALAHRKIKSVAQANEIDAAQGIQRLTGTLVQQVAETDLAQALFPLKRVAVAQAVEVEFSQAFGISKVKAIGQAGETNLAQAIIFAGAVLRIISVNSIAYTDIQIQSTANDPISVNSKSVTLIDVNAEDVP